MHDHHIIDGATSTVLSESPRPMASFFQAALRLPPRKPTLEIERQRRTAEYLLRVHAAIVEFAYDALIGTTLDGKICTWNHAAARLFGYTAIEAVGRNLSFLAAPAQDAEQRDLLVRACGGSPDAPRETTRLRRDGTTVDIELNFMPIRDARGNAIALAAVARDISARKRADTHRALLAEELAHRVKNTLATVQSIARHSLQGAASLESFGAAFSARLGALATTHTLLTHNGWAGVLLSDLVEAELSVYASAGTTCWSAAGDVVVLDPQRALALGMGLHELATNAAKYGALSAAGGHVSVSWELRKVGEETRLTLAWQETGGPAVAPPTRRGFGTQMMTRGLAREMDGEVVLSFPEAGACCRMDVPLSGKVPA